MLLFASTILLSAFLLFLVQPIIAKQILPWFGGTSAVWITCLVFFQVVLLAGYTYAHLSTRHLSPRAQSRLHIALLIASLLFLPIVPSAALKPTAEADAALRIIVLLVATIGLPYFLLSTTGPLLQKWVAPSFPEKSVYRLFALSNFGSLIGLLAFPFAIEPFTSSTTQSIAWSIAYAAFVLTCGISAWKVGRQDAAPHVVALGNAESLREGGRADASPPRPTDYLLWLALSALASVMLLASTSHITQNIASVPFLWVLPLSLYLLTFVIAFEGRGGRGWYEQNWWLFLTLMLIVGMAAGLSAARGVLDIGIAVPLYTLGMFMSVLFCNGELAHRKPAPRYLTNFYLMISLGGALGGLVRRPGGAAPIPGLLRAADLRSCCSPPSPCVVAWRNRWLVGPAIVATLATGWYGIEYVDFVRNDVVFMERNFYGTLRVREQGSGEYQVRRLLHGVILHGEQFTIHPERLEPGTYYARTSGVGRAISAKQAGGPVRLGVVGLGVGTLSAYGRARRLDPFLRTRSGRAETGPQPLRLPERFAREARVRDRRRAAVAGARTGAGRAAEVRRAGHRCFLERLDPRAPDHARGHPAVHAAPGAGRRTRDPHFESLPRPEAGARQHCPRGRSAGAADLRSPARARVRERLGAAGRDT